MRELSVLNLGSSDATNYRNNKRLMKMFSAVFVKDEHFDKLLQPDTYFLVGDKGTGKTAYAVFLENHEQSNTKSRVIDIANTDYQIFMNLQKLGFLKLSDFSRVWKIILLMLMANEIQEKDIKQFGPKRSKLYQELKNSIDSYYDHAFIPEISTSFRYVLDNAFTAEGSSGAEVKAKLLNASANVKLSETEKLQTEHSVQIFQNNLLQLEKRFYAAFEKLKIKGNKFLFIDSVDIKMENFSLDEFYNAIRSLGQAVWEVNTTLFNTMPESDGFLKIVMTIRTDLYPKLNLHNQANKLRDNSVVLDWRTTYDDYRTSNLFKLCNRLLAFDNVGLAESEYWDYYFPWSTSSTNPRREKDDSFINCMKYSLSRPRDMISIMKAIQATNKVSKTGAVSCLSDFADNKTENSISGYYIDEAKDWCLHRFSNDEFKTLLHFFQFLNGKARFSYQEFVSAFRRYIVSVKNRKMSPFLELDDCDKFLQLLYDLNIICYYEKDRNGHEFFRFCYREREIHNLEPQIMTETNYSVHYSLLKALNLGKSSGYSY